MRIERISSTRDLVEAIARLPAARPLPCRTALVSRERVAHGLRRELVRAGHINALAGTRFVPVVAAAGAVLRAGGVEFTPGEEALRPARLLALFRDSAMRSQTLELEPLLVVERAPLAVLWPAVRGFLAEWLLQPGDGPRVQSLLDERLDAAAGDGTCGALAGDDALRIIEEAIESVRLAVGRFGEPAV